MRRFRTTVPELLARAGLAEPSHDTGFALCDAYARAYVQSGRAAQAPPRRPVVPAPRVPLDDSVAVASSRHCAS